jgi:hypothetical protein
MAEDRRDMKFKLLSPAVVVSLVTLCSCVPPKDPAELRHEAEMAESRRLAAVNAPGDLVLKEIPPMPAGTKVAAKEPTFRSRTLDLPDGRWSVNFEGDEIKIVTGSRRNFALPMSWYPEEGGADGAFCSAYLDGPTTWIVLKGSSDYTTEASRIRFERGVMKEVVKHRVPGPQGSEVPAAERIKSQTF